MNRSLRSERTLANPYVSRIIHTIGFRLWTILATCETSLRLWESHRSGFRRSCDNMHRGLRSEQTDKTNQIWAVQSMQLASDSGKPLPSAELAWNSRTDNCGARCAHIKICTEACPLSKGMQIHIWAEQSIQLASDFVQNLTSAKLACSHLCRFRRS